MPCFCNRLIQSTLGEKYIPFIFNLEGVVIEYVPYLLSGSDSSQGSESRRLYRENTSLTKLPAIPQGRVLNINSMYIYFIQDYKYEMFCRVTSEKETLFGIQNYIKDKQNYITTLCWKQMSSLIVKPLIECLKYYNFVKHRHRLISSVHCLGLISE